jgi:hypothetical protein
MVNAIYASYGPALAFPANPEGQPGHLCPVNRVDNVYGVVREGHANEREAVSQKRCLYANRFRNANRSPWNANG